MPIAQSPLLRAACGLVLLLVALGVLIMKPQGSVAKEPESPPDPKLEVATFALG